MFRILVVLLLTVAGLQAVAVDADFNGEYRFRVSSDSNTGDNLLDNLGTSLSSKTRAKISGSFRPSESFEGVAALYLDLDVRIPLRDRVVAYGDWMISDEFMLRVGQSTYKIADGSVIGINDYDAVPTLFNGLFLTHSSENVGLDIALVGNKELSKEGNDQVGERYQLFSLADELFIVSVDAHSFPDLVKTANFHLIVKDVRDKVGLSKSQSPVENDAQGEMLAASEAPAATEEENDGKGVYLGATLGGGAGGFGYKVTASTDSLTNVLSLSNLLLNGKVSYSFEMDNSTLKAYVGGHMDGSDYDALLYERHHNAGKMDKVQWGRGLTYAYGGLSYNMNTDWKVGLKGYYFIDSNKDVNLDTQVSDGDAEVDVYVKKSFNSSVSGKVWAGVLVPESGDNADLMAQAVIKMKF